MFDLAKDFRSILPKLSDQTLHYIHDELNTLRSPSVKRVLHDIETEQRNRKELPEE